MSRVGITSDGQITAQLASLIEAAAVKAFGGLLRNALEQIDRHIDDRLGGGH